MSSNERIIIPPERVNKAKTAAERRESPHLVQIEWMDAARGKRVTVLLASGKAYAGTLGRYDTYCFELLIKDHPPMLVYKHAVACLMGSAGETSAG